MMCGLSPSIYAVSLVMRSHSLTLQLILSRNYTGIMLIDRNDELCILYEKHNIQVRTLGERSVP